MSRRKPDSRKVADAVLHYYCASVNAFVLGRILEIEDRLSGLCSF